MISSDELNRLEKRHGKVIDSKIFSDSPGELEVRMIRSDAKGSKEQYMLHYMETLVYEGSEGAYLKPFTPFPNKLHLESLWEYFTEIESEDQFLEKSNEFNNHLYKTLYPEKKSWSEVHKDRIKQPGELVKSKDLLDGRLKLIKYQSDIVNPGKDSFVLMHETKVGVSCFFINDLLDHTIAEYYFNRIDSEKNMFHVGRKQKEALKTYDFYRTSFYKT